MEGKKKLDNLSLQKLSIKIFTSDKNKKKKVKC